MFLITILPRNICIILDVIKTLSIPVWHCCTASAVVQEMATLSERDVTVPSSFKAHPLCKYLEEITQILRNVPTSRWNIQLNSNSIGISTCTSFLISMQHFKFEQHGETWRETLRDENEPIANLSQQSRWRIKPRVQRDASALGSLQFLIIVLTYLIY